MAEVQTHNDWLMNELRSYDFAVEYIAAAAADPEVKVLRSALNKVLEAHKRGYYDDVQEKE